VLITFLLLLLGSHLIARLKKRNCNFFSVSYVSLACNFFSVSHVSLACEFTLSVQYILLACQYYFLGGVLSINGQFLFLRLAIKCMPFLTREASNRCVQPPSLSWPKSGLEISFLGYIQKWNVVYLENQIQKNKPI